MARRRELKSIASGFASHCISRNNDTFGYWALGMIYNVARKSGEDLISIDCTSGEPLPKALAEFRRLFLERFETGDSPLYRFIRGFVVDFHFEPYATSAVRGQQARVICTVHIIDDLDMRRSASATTFCYPHNPLFERKSTRG